MENNERMFLESEVAVLENILSKLDDSQFIEKISYQGRLEQVKQKLSELSVTVVDTMRLTFKGDPVDGSHGIFADFAAKAVGKFSEAFAAFAAIAEGKTLASRGLIPDSDKHRLLITQTALGSFGFELQLPVVDDAGTQQPSLLPEDNYITIAKNKLETVINDAINGDDEQLADSMNDIDKRAIEYVQSFFEILNQERAIFTLNSGSRRIVCSNQDILREATGRLKSDNIVERETEFGGQFLGILPENRDFEFKNYEGVVIKGKIDKSVGRPDLIFSNWYMKPVKVKLRSRTIGGGRPRYMLESLDNIVLQEV